MATIATTVPSTIGGSLPRVDGPLKVSGAAMYASDHHFPGMLYAVPVCSTIGKGRISSLESSVAEQMPGVRAVYHRGNIGRLFRSAPAAGISAYLDERRPPFEDDVMRYYGQYVAVVIAQTFEQAEAAAAAVKVSYSEEKPDVRTRLDTDEKPRVDSSRGDAERAFAGASIKLDETYGTPVETHNPIELHASVAVWDGESFTLYESSQAVVNHRDVLAQMLGVPTENVRVISRFLGSGFGSKLWPWPHSLLAAAASRNLSRPVKLVISRQMMFQNVGHRPRTQQRVRLSATAEGKLTSLQHDYLNHTSILDDYEENCGEATSYLYGTPNLRITSGLVRRNIGTPTAMRGPGAVPGLFATESAMDELAIKLKLDPVELRLRNEPENDQSTGLPFSSRHLTECLTLGARKFGWSQRTPQVVLMAATKAKKSPFAGRSTDALGFRNGRVYLKEQAPETGVVFQDILEQSNINVASGSGKSAGTFGSTEPRKYSTHSFGARGIGEIGHAGIAAALTSAVYHATGVRVRELPIRIEHLL